MEKLSSFIHQLCTPLLSPTSSHLTITPPLPPNLAPTATPPTPLAPLLSPAIFSSPSPPLPLPFDPVTVMAACHSAGLHDQALAIAFASQDVPTALTCLLHHQHDYSTALKIFGQLKEHSALLSAAREFGPLLASHLPEETVGVCLRFCLGFDPTTGSPRGSHAGNSGGNTSSSASASANSRASVGGNVASAAHSSSAFARPASSLSSTATRSSTNPSSVSSFSAPPAKPLPTPRFFITSETIAQEHLVSPMDLSLVFVDSPALLLSFLHQFVTAAADSPWHCSIFNALLELYLSLARTPLSPPTPDVPSPHVTSAREPEAGRHSRAYASKLEQSQDAGEGRSEAHERTAAWLAHGRGGVPQDGPADRAAWQAKASALLKTNWPMQSQTGPRYDADLALLTCQVHGFKEGLLFLYERMRLYKEVLQLHVQVGDSDGVAALWAVGSALALTRHESWPTTRPE